MINSRISIVSHPQPWQTLQARTDYAHISGQDVVERPWWYRDNELTYLYYDLFGCVGWPEEVSESKSGKPGYCAIVGVIRDSGEVKKIPAKDARFVVLDEFESDDVPTLVAEMVKMRSLFGYGINKMLLTEWYGDAERFQTTLALCNERLGEDKAVWITTGNDSEDPQKFDIFVRSLRSCLVRGKQRLFPGPMNIVGSRLQEFYRNDPAILAIGGLIHSLLLRVMWMDGVDGAGGFNVDEGVM